MVVLFATKLIEPRDVTDAVADLAKRLGAELLVLHVAPPAPASAFTSVDPMTGLGDLASYALYDPQLQRELEKAEATAFEQFLAERFSEPVRASLKVGYPAAMILEDANEHGADIIVVGKRHHGRIEKFLMGDVAGEVVEQAKLPVVLMPFEPGDGK
ncbi:MAG: universal stress protein [Rhodothermales bacterium]|nr:universal stress protein [Rhodothermales bacterium]